MLNIVPEVNMALTIKVKKGLDIPLQGKSLLQTTKLPLSDSVTLIPDHYPINPKLAANVGDVLSIGSPVFFDKNNPDVFVVSPVCGELLAVNRGERRKILSVEIRCNGDLSQKNIPSLNPLSNYDELVAVLKASGLWVHLRQRPFDTLVNSSLKPKAIFVQAYDSAPLAPDYNYLIKGQEAEFEAGLEILTKLTTGKVYVSAKQGSGIESKHVNVQMVYLQGPHPVGNPSVMIQQMEPLDKGQTVWTINFQSLIFMGRYVLSGKLDFTKIIALTGPQVIKPQYYESMLGTSVVDILKNNIQTNNDLRIISGNVLTGTQISAEGCVFANDSQLTVIEEGSQTHELLGWAMPRFNSFSINKSYFSWLKKSTQAHFDARVLGGERAIIFSGEYDKVFPFDILPEYLVKAMITKDIDRMEALGIYEVLPEDFALCEYVCTSKMQLQQIAKDAIDYLRKEIE